MIASAPKEVLTVDEIEYRQPLDFMQIFKPETVDKSDVECQLT